MLHSAFSSIACSGETPAKTRRHPCYLNFQGSGVARDKAAARLTRGTRHRSAFKFQSLTFREQQTSPGVSLNFPFQRERIYIGAGPTGGISPSISNVSTCFFVQARRPTVLEDAIKMSAGRLSCSGTDCQFVSLRRRGIRICATIGQGKENTAASKEAFRPGIYQLTGKIAL